MTLRELAGTNQQICQLWAYVRDYTNGSSKLMQAYHIGYGETKDKIFPKEERWITISKSINAKDDGKDYWQTKLKVIPEEILEMEVNSWQLWVSRTSNNGLNKHYWLNVDLVGKKDEMAAELPKVKEEPQLQGQMNIMDFLEE